MMGLLARQLDRKFAVADAGGEIFGITRRGLFAVGRNKLGESEEQRGLRQAIAVDAVVQRLRPGVLKIAERDAFLVAFGQSAAWREIVRRCRHPLVRQRSPNKGSR